MSKRKRDAEHNGSDSRPTGTVRSNFIKPGNSKFKNVFSRSITILETQLKLARGFDRQKMGRRLNAAVKAKDGATQKRLNAEIVVLKEMNCAKVADRYLIKQCLKTKRISETEEFSKAIGNTDDVREKLKNYSGLGNSGNVSAEGNVLARLMKSNSVNEVLPGIMTSIKKSLNLDVPALSDRNISNSVEQLQRTSAIGSEEDHFEGFSDDPAVQRNGSHDPPTQSTVNGQFDEDEINDQVAQAYEGRLATSTDANDEVDDHIGSNSDISAQNHDRNTNYDMEITTDEEQDQSSGENDIPLSSGSDSDSVILSATKPQSRKAKAVKSTPSTSFLPSLMHGGYYSGSDSEEHEDELPSNLKKPERKNRRGQRERQLIAEKKFGARAKHLMKERGMEIVNSARQGMIASGQKRETGWDSKRGAVDLTRGRGRASGRREVGESSGRKALNRSERRSGSRRGGNDGGRSGRVNVFSKARSTGANSDPVSANGRFAPAAKMEGLKSNGGNGKLHPSWEAAKKRKMEKSAGAESFAGKKITFD